MLLESLQLSNFRNYRAAALSFQSDSVVLCGPNGAGKTNILEAISLFAVGTGLRNTPVINLLNTNAQSEGWAVSAAFSDDFRLGVGLNFDSLQRPRRVYKIQGEPVKSAVRFHDYVRIIGITPDMDHLFTDASQMRRRFIDQLISAYMPEHASHLHAYEKAMKQRLMLLKKGQLHETRWLDSLEKIMSQENCRIAFARQQLMHKLTDGQTQQLADFPRFTNRMVGVVDALVQEQNAQEVMIHLQNQLAEKRLVDQAAGMTTLGCHRSDWEVTHAQNRRLVKECSTGEQKIMLIAVILAFTWHTLLTDERLLFLLLDDVIARLDLRHRVVLFKQIKALQQCTRRGTSVQTFFSGTDFDLFEGLENTQMLWVEDAQITERRL